METNGNKTEVTYWRSAKIPTVQYGSRDICLTIKGLATQGNELEEYNRIKDLVDKEVEAQANAITNTVSDNDYRLKDGKKYPRVSKILSPDPILIPNIEKYAVRGTEIHVLVNNYLQTGKWDEPICDISPLKWTDIKYKEFFEKFGINFGKDFQLELECYNETHLYSGEIDFLGIYDGKMTLGDFKTGTWKLEQIASYKKCLKGVEQLAIFDLKKNDVLTWQVDEPEVWEAFERFLILRGMFKQRFNV